MKAQIHPQYYPEAQVTCACGNKFTVGSTLPQIKIDVCSKCHPFFTGQLRYVDTAGRVDRFKAKQIVTEDQTKVSKKLRRQEKRNKKIEEELSRPTTLEALRAK
ncbi:MAG: 50S ribosomal protein L31 [Candidatus Blackburnbacteria bacterium RIFCSPHIGHO2_01_FULL_44_64]|uniref:Large ribosomal subunit protein bL31 n=1 Tax=Candidatus Blackburnbacteria bacterium RIFCSPHIGHO2_02_FULL_44_20 TaxID=1797516 RepID=A0A1G1V7R2_9BACT|nr:MAG: 50S ribosomal protein L31 [Candidatus Blackburnbacteria bacterium RIFCSPHIGHO2_01_FULL_44_64]OGY11192.1 MAG: 50S ribosomal protein L31 [Candidatus Blackburnbacteria bacterium RIFCSPHIGHO2_12_FULL_44_25]OGY11479.1 MAG: 50S ribosomal protein L31 [Candidatus Blackburnbacteria bacterium RIFCSPHIGHO2_02_FULL_44_20]OGY15162.1 MAG: 50S ribosomal protein L31 [Candidatus Blackburnbacteria bacterium RIFCSPLOWO2_01_FULL_44_43]